jgi:DNA-binding NtrC family response regulator
MTLSPILIVDDDPSICFAFKKTFEELNYKTVSANNGKEAIQVFKESSPSLIFMDISMPDMNGLEALARIKELNPDIPVIIITGEGNMQTAIRAMQLGAYDYLTKPLDVDKVRLTGTRAFEMVKMRQKINELEKRINRKKHDGRTIMVGQHQKMQEVFKKIGIISTTPLTTNILILGETGTGKEIVARIIHESCANAQEPFQVINCTVLPENLLESELFGHEKGAFTGADRLKIGKFENAGKGTLFLDEIGDLSVNLQKKLLRVLQERSFERLGGGNTSIDLNARIIAATHLELGKAVKEGYFREDLYYRLNVIEINLPPLREKKDDIPLLVNHFISKFNDSFDTRIKNASDEVINTLQNYHFPGNVRELENLIERAVALERGDYLTKQSFPSDLNINIEPQSIDIPILDDQFSVARDLLITEFEKKYIIKKLSETVGNVTEAARLSGIKRQSFQRLMKINNISSKDFKSR